MIEKNEEQGPSWDVQTQRNDEQVPSGSVQTQQPLSHVEEASSSRQLDTAAVHGIILDNDKTLAEKHARDGDSLYLCTIRPGPNVPFFKDNMNISLIFSCAIALLIGLGIILAYLVALRYTSNGGYNYGVVVDAGSVHTTVSVFEWPLNGTEVVREVFSCEVNSEEGISSFGWNPKEVRKYLTESKCYTDASLFVPEILRPRTEIYLGATAGMRVLEMTNRTAANYIMSNVSVTLNESVFKKRTGSAEIISAEDEGVLGWASANYAGGGFTNNGTKLLGALDWGGASSQITFAIDSPSNSTRPIRIHGKTYNVFTASNLCYGQAEALRRYFVGLVFRAFSNGNNVSLILDSPCQPRSIEWYPVKAADLFYSPCTKYKDMAFRSAVEKLPADQLFKFVGQSDREACVVEIKKSFDLDVCQATYEEDHCFHAGDIIPTRMRSSATKFSAFSTYWYLVSYLKFPLTNLHEPDFEHVISNLCNSSLSYAKNLLPDRGAEVQHNSCFRGLFMQSLLVNGYKFADNVWNAINFVDNSWTLGYMALRTNDMPTVEDFSTMMRLLLQEFIVGFIVLLVLIYLVVNYCCQTSRDRKKRSDYNQLVKRFKDTCQTV